MVNNLRNSILKGFAAANKIHYKYNLSKGFVIGKTYLDVFETIQNEGIILCFRPLENMHGAYIPSDQGQEGILINSKHPLHIQRFTAAHELGHHVLKHKPSIDTQILGRGPLPTDSYDGNVNEIDQEREADSFASAFLMPKWLIVEHLKAIGENFNYLKSEKNIYQMSLRLGVSYIAFCWSLYGHEILSFQEVKKVASIKPKDIKKEFVPEDILNLNPWANVWIINDKSAGVKILGDINDIFVLEIEENPSTGYIWDYSHFPNHELRILTDNIVEENQEVLGSKIKRQVIFTNDNFLIDTLHIDEKRPWNNDTASSLPLTFCLTGKGKGFYHKVDILDAA